MADSQFRAASLACTIPTAASGAENTERPIGHVVGQSETCIRQRCAQEAWSSPSCRSHFERLCECVDAAK